MRPRLLDLFCGAGGCSMGYHRAGFDVVGVDVKRHRRYPFEFIHADALAFLADGGSAGFDAVHASPPCQHYSITRHTHHKQHPDLLAPTRDALITTGLPYVIENVPGAPLRNPITLCGAAFNLTATDTDGSRLVLRRHRLFESNIWLWPVECECLTYADRGYRVGGAYGGGSESRAAAGRRGGGYTPTYAIRRELLGIDWMSGAQLSQAIPPAYTQHIGEQLLTHLQEMAS